MPSFERLAVDRRTHVREVAQRERDTANRSVLAGSTPARPDITPVLLAVVWIEDDPRRSGQPYDLAQHVEFRSLAPQWHAAIEAVTNAPIDTVQCWVCGAHVGYGEHERESRYSDRMIPEYRWTVLALVQAADEGSEGSQVTVQCEGCAPSADMDPWPADAPAATPPWDVADQLAVLLTAETAYSLTGEDVRRLIAQARTGVTRG